MVRKRLAPSRTPSGANTELHETAKALSSVPPHASPLAFCSAKPSMVASVWIAKVSLRDTRPAPSSPVDGDDLHRRPGWLQARERDPGGGEHGAGARVHRHHAGVATPDRGDHGALHRRVDRGPQIGCARAGRAGGDHALTGAERAPRGAGQPGLEDPLQSVEPDRGVGGVAQCGVVSGLRVRDRTDHARRSPRRRREWC